MINTDFLVIRAKKWRQKMNDERYALLTCAQGMTYPLGGLDVHVDSRNNNLRYYGEQLKQTFTGVYRSIHRLAKDLAMHMDDDDDETDSRSLLERFIDWREANKERERSRGSEGCSGGE